MEFYDISLSNLGLCVILFTVGLCLIHLSWSFYVNASFKKDKQYKASRKRVKYRSATFILFLIISVIVIEVGKFGQLFLFATCAFTISSVFFSTLRNLCGGIVIKIIGLFRENDLIKIDDVLGEVYSSNLMFTKVELHQGGLYITPNQKLLTQDIYNFTLNGMARAVLNLELKDNLYSKELDKPLLKAVSKSQLVLLNPRSSINVYELRKNDNPNDKLVSIHCWSAIGRDEELYDEMLKRASDFFIEYISHHNLINGTFDVLKD